MSARSKWINFGQYWAMSKQLPRKHQLFLYVVVAQCMYVMAERTYVFATDLSDNERDAVWFYVVIFLSLGYLFYFAVHSVMHVNEFELLAFMITSGALVFRVGFEFYSRWHRCKKIIGVCGTMVGVNISFNVVYWYMYIRMSQDLRWTKYKAIGADPVTRRVYRRYELFSAMRKLGVQFSLQVLVTGFVFFTESPDYFAGLLPSIVLFILEIVWERLGVTGIKEESAYRLFGFWALSPLLPAFIIIVAVVVEEAHSSPQFGRLRHDREIPTMLLFAALAIISRIVTIVCSFQLFREFGGEGYIGLRRIFKDGRSNAFDRLYRKLSNRKNKTDTVKVRFLSPPKRSLSGVEVVDLSSPASPARPSSPFHDPLTPRSGSGERVQLDLPVGVVRRAALWWDDDATRHLVNVDEKRAEEVEQMLLERAAQRRQAKSEIEAKAASLKKKLGKYRPKSDSALLEPLLSPDSSADASVMPSLRPPAISAPKPVEPAVNNGLGPVKPPETAVVVGARVMAPPPLPDRAKRASVFRKKVLDEEEYLEKMGKIIERDFFPDLPKLGLQLKWMQALESKDPGFIAAVRQEIKQRTAQTPLLQDPQAIATPIATPLFRPDSHSTSEVSSVTEHSGGSGEGVDPTNDEASTVMSLDAFHATHTTEDNVSFEELLEKQQATKRRAYWWAYDEDAAVKTTQLAIENRPHHAEFDDETKHIEDRTARPPIVNSWPHRTQNQLYALPDLSVSKQTSGMRGDSAELSALALTAPASGSSQQSVALTVPSGYKVTDDGGLLPPKVIRHANTRFSQPAVSSGVSSAAAASGTPSAPELEPGVSGYALVRSPSPTPGDADDEPIMTWGDIASTPLILDTKLDTTGLPSQFRVSQLPERDALAHTLDLKVKAKKQSETKKRERSVSSASRRSAGSGTLTPLMLAHMTPQAQQLAHKVLGKAGVGDSSLRASYSGLGSMTGRRATSTPVATPIKPRDKTGVAQSTSGNAAGTTSLTDNLLKFS